ncbi:hypothetical protein Pcinc_021699 [Petrolisthes cinctipes]|uniref:Nucleolar protein 14 n=1 Tax=Petrolisthes cinctipes TaxID=88211 RepID=A0AAE1FHG6_PETCI|nr:hypothetical protein Pcinc_021699 [Petrolisthes cinctipes]
MIPVIMAKKKASQFKSKAAQSAGKKNEKKHNPFEVHINRVKHDVIGRKNKNDIGLPGISRAKAVKKRERTLLQEYKHSYKSNVFVDRRIGEHNPRMDPEKKIALRIAAEKKRQFSKKSLFNLNDDEELTHGGLVLNDTNINDRIQNSDDEDDNMLDAKFVKEQHFGGGLFTKHGASEDTDKPKSKKEWIDDMIAESKKKKAESRKEKDDQYEAVAKLDSELQTFMKLMANQTLTDDDKDKAKKSGEFRDYDSLVRELEFDRSGKARAVEKLKTPEQLIKEERDRLLSLEAERVRRMKGEKVKENTKSYSADDLDDGFMIEGDDNYHVSYKDGKILTTASQEEMDQGEGDEEEGEEEEEDEDIENMGEKDDDEGEGGNDDDDKNDDDDDDDGDDDDESDKYSDILEDSASEEEDNDIQTVKNKTSKSMNDPQKKEIMEAAKNEIPYTFEVPQDYDAFWCLLENRSPSEVNIILDRMITCNHTTLGATNKDKCDDIFAYLLQTLHMLTDVDSDSPITSISGMEYVDAIIPHLYTLTHLSQANSAKSFLQVLDEKYADCSNMKFKRYPLANTFVFLKVGGMLFPPSDFIHPVMTPVLTFLTHLLGQARVTTKREVTAALFTAHLLLEYLSASKRFVPELMNLFNGLLYMAIPDQNKAHLPLSPPFKRSSPAAMLLVLESEVAEYTESKLPFRSLNSDEDDLDDEFKINIIYKVIRSIKHLCCCWSEVPSVHSILTPTYQLLKHFHLELYPTCVRESVQKLLASIEHLQTQGLVPLVKEEKKPVTIAMMEPAIEKIIDGKLKRHGTKEYLEKQKLLHKLKRERKGARREIQQDNVFMARQKLAETLQRDAERAKKMRQIMSELQLQEGEVKKMKKKK